MNKVNLEYIKSERKSRKLSLQEMADLLGFKNASNYYKYESGEYEFSANHIYTISKAFKKSLKNFFVS
ncbi:XRE family transcriptional regulator [Periweissella cryptocerci]|uniref:XRE family transcriptional regulator n=1 Tax=Periweissella cryptocerci TaxID=2506420 RepID=A0A4P6YVT9_9LACO|nr:helix-turn-helix transcriptional regulator [Periweissella cryptocerci]QBO36942.1 XRE family transcriptional regulator [Periweissella cryptocerci]